MVNDGIKKSALAVLKKNLVQGDGFFYTCPSLRTYQHQWFWDSCFHAIVWTYFNPEYAKMELLTLVKKQFDNGLIPHMLYWKRAKGRTAKLGDILFKRAWPEKDRSHITQPPVLAQAVAKVYEKTMDDEFLNKMIHPLIKFYDWLHDERNLAISGDGLVSIIHPWESGLDASPTWDHVHDITRLLNVRIIVWYNTIIKKNNEANWDIEQIKEQNDFLVKEIGFNVIYIINLRILANLCKTLGLKKRANEYLTRAETAQKTLVKKCWSKEDLFFYSITSIEDKILPEKTVTGLFPLLLNIDPRKINYLIYNYLINPNEFWLPYPIPSVAKSSPKFNPNGGATMIIWRGPTWVNTNWYIVKALQYHGFHGLAQYIISKMKVMIEQSGFREQYNPINATAYGAKNFSWSTLIVDLL